MKKTETIITSFNVTQYPANAVVLFEMTDGSHESFNINTDLGNSGECVSKEDVLDYAYTDEDTIIEELGATEDNDKELIKEAVHEALTTCKAWYNLQ